MFSRLPTIVAAILTVAAVTVRPAAAQVTPASGFPPADDMPSVKVGGTLFADFTRTAEPAIRDADGNQVTPASFNVSRAYLNVTGQVNRVIAFRITPDVSRETGAGSSLAGSMTLRLKYAYAQVNLDDWLWRGTYARVGMIQTPYVDFEETVYRYRFQGTVFVEREAFLTSSDAGASMRTQLPGGYGEVVGGYYNGEGFSRADPNDQKALQLRATVRPLPGPGTLRGIRASIFYDRDHYVRNDDRLRTVSLITFEHRFVNAGWVHLDAHDQPTAAAARVHASGDSLWVTPRWIVGTVEPSAPSGQVRASVEGLLRYDRLQPNQADASVKDRLITGVAYWPRTNVSSVTSALLVDVETVRYRDFAPERPTEKRLAVHVLVSF